MLARLRRTGADPPFGDPRAYHGVAMEGYFWRLTDVASGSVVVALAAVNRDGEGRPWGVVALALHPGGHVRSAVVADAHAAGPGLHVTARDADGHVLEASDERLRVDLGPDARLDVRFDDRAGWPRALGGVGFGHLVPRLGQYWHPHLLGARVRGQARIGGRDVTLDGAAAYGEKNWGAGFPEAGWWWGHAQAFEREDVCVAFAGGPVHAGPLRLHAGALVARVGDDLVHVVRPPWRVHAEPGTEWRLLARTPRHTVEVEARPTGVAPLLLPVPVPADRRAIEGPSAQHLAAEMSVVVRRGRRTLFAGTSPLAGLEHGAPVALHLPRAAVGGARAPVPAGP